MKKNRQERIDRTDLVFILDRSGSMAGLGADTIGGFNSLIEKQKREAGECWLTTVLFNHSCKLLHDRVNLKDVRPLTDREYTVGGTTALLDAIGLTIRRIANAQRLAPAHLRADRVLFVITTDGMENASREFSREQIRRMIELEKTQYDWEFIFLGANIDAVETASNFGIAPSRASNYRADSRGTRLNFDVLSETVSQMRACGCIAEDWNARIDEDYTGREE